LAGQWTWVKRTGALLGGRAYRRKHIGHGARLSSARRVAEGVHGEHTIQQGARQTRGMEMKEGMSQD
jgi:hypothetical protein